jgi:hypothetical protein
MENYSSKTEAIIGLQKKGYDLDFILNNEYLLCLQDSELISPDDFEVAETYSFESKATSGDQHLIYAINSVHNGIKGILMTPYSAFTRGLSIHLWSKLAANLN